MAAIISFLVLLLAIYVLAIITDEFFINSLDVIAEKGKLPSDVAGASLMAMGSSAPELFIALLALFKEGGAHSDVGIGTIVGSAVFNILVITGVSSVIREAKIKLPAVSRDTAFYLGSILFLLYAFWDGTITMQDSVFFLILYVIYLAVLFLVPMSAEEPDVTGEPDESASGLDSTPPTEAPAPQAANYYTVMREYLIRWIRYCTGDPRESYIRAFFVSIAFIAAISWILVDCAVIFATAVGIPPVVIALTILAAGTSAPDLISSMIVAKQGRGGMAVANAIGSNIFDILVGLGLPWLLAFTLLGRSAITVKADDLLLSTLILFATVVTLFVFLFTGRKLSKKEGWCLIAIYAVYVVWTFISG